MRKREFGLQQKPAVIREIRDGAAHVRDPFGNEHVVGLNTIPGKSATPSAGETWLITAGVQGWSFVHLLSPPVLPEVVGARTGADPLAVSLLDALVTLGLVRDGTSS